MTFFKYVKELMRSNSGESSKGFSFVTVTLTSLGLLTICGVSLIIDVIINGHIVTDLVGMAAFVTSISTLLGAVGFTKVYGDKMDYDNYNTNKNNRSCNNKVEETPTPKISEEEANKVI